ncbi:MULTISPECIES: hypothetical protein [Providencia]|uniref:hypothetical protein n=1 Tax=Providencia TaxID=586 RepID=UPI00155E9006|nr:MULTISPECIES: hypothetical protein [Providencia]QKG43211.1 hypothetical protein HRD55_00805 [Providencia rettgeri]QNN33337.1 hypothetical protein H9X60_00805 [Providencia rettgeri]
MDITSPSRLDNISHFSPQATSTEQPHLPLFGGGITFDESLMPHQQVLDVFRQMQYSVPEGIYQQRPQNDSPENIQLRARMLVRENKSANDAYEEAKALRATRRTETLEDGRSHINRLTGLIDNIHVNYQKKYGELVKASTQYMQDMNTLASKLSRYIEAGKNGKIHIKIEDTLRVMDEIVAKYSGTSVAKVVKTDKDEVKDKSLGYTLNMAKLQVGIAEENKKIKLFKQMIILFPNKGVEQSLDAANRKLRALQDEYQQLQDKLDELNKIDIGKIEIGEYFGKWKPDFDNAKPLMKIKGTEQEYTFWEKKLSEQGFTVKRMKGELYIFPDLKPVKEMFHAINHSSGAWNDGSDIMSQEFQSLQTAIDSQKNAINSSVSRLLETFRQDNSHFETLTQLLIQLYKDLQQYNNGYVNM